MSINCLYYILPMFILIMLISSYYTYIICLCTLLKNNLLETCILLLFYNIIFIMLLWSFLSTVFTPLAEVPLEYKLTNEEAAIYERSNQQDRHSFLQNIVRKKNLVIHTLHENGYIRYCIHCKQIKPDRSHHCSTCRVCVLRMDHHCPWVNNCVGYSNFKCFVLLMFYCVIYSVYSVATSYQFIFSSWDGDTNLEFLPVVVGFVLAAILGLVGLMFLLFNINLLLLNKTTLERMKTPKFIQPNASFNLGCKRNFLEVFGTNCLLWPLPFFTGLGTGYTFLIRE